MTSQTIAKPLQRESNIELLRLVAMAMIVLHHFIFHGLGLYRSIRFGETPIMTLRDTQLALVADSFLIYGVNIFVLISGWFSIQFKTKGFVKLFAICSFFAFIGYTTYLLYNDIPFSVGQILRLIKRSFFVLSSKTWWFVQLYFILMFFSGPINQYVERTSQKMLRNAIIVLLFINVYLGWVHKVEFVIDGYNLFNFIMLYLIGRYLRLYWKNDYKGYKDLLVFLGAAMVTAFLTIVVHKRGGDVFHMLGYNSPFIIIGSVAVLLWFTKMHFQNQLINYMAASSLAIYLVQDGVFNFYRFIKQLYIDGTGLFAFSLYMLLFFFLSMFVPIAVDKVRLFLFGRLEEKTAKVIDEKIVKRYIEDAE